MGRMALYSGKELTWDEAAHFALRLAPSGYTWDATPPIVPDAQGNYPIAMPGITVAS
jgi:myo-inositol 2-dehydrogenase / D-chiro-inositol 1-dehydrogenase